MTSRSSAPLLALGLGCMLSAVASAGEGTSTVKDGDWSAYGRTSLGDRHSPLTQIDKHNVARLAVAWRYHTGENEAGREGQRPARLSVTPLVIAGRMYFSTAMGKIIALDAASGRELWTFDAAVKRTIGFGDPVSRGVSYWAGAGKRSGAACETRILAGVLDGRLLALDALTGKPCTGFGKQGTVNLREGLRNPPAGDWEYELTSPPAIVGNIVVVGSAVADNNRLDAASGEVRGYDVVSGRLAWRWDPVPQDPNDPAYASWQGPKAHRTGGANTWSVIAADAARGLVFLPTTSPSVDYWGGARLGDNRHANSVVALDARSGKQVWAFQTVHHDLWDYDNASPPALVDVTLSGRLVAAVLVATKSGQLFVLDRATGKPLFPVEERKVPASDALGEVAAATQPFSSLPALSPLSISRDDLIQGLPDPDHRAACLAQLDALRNEGSFTPPSERGTLMLPSNIGGAHWGGVAFDPASQTVMVPTNRIAAVITLLPRDAEATKQAREAKSGERLGLEFASMAGSPYVLKREIFAAGGRPCTPAPLGTLHAISLKTGKTVWNVPLGTGVPPLGPVDGMVNLGGPITTATGLLFIGATPDPHLRAFDIASGQVLWTGTLPAGARSTPMTYEAQGRQFVAIAAGGDGELWGSADEIVAFSLEKQSTR
ncbi:MAG: pyrroloquinoline quinone-dependent dehydrogenase [Thermomonas sp.]